MNHLLVLEGLSPFKGNYVAYTSQPFPAYHFGGVHKNSALNFPIPVKNGLLHQPKGKEWLEQFFAKRRTAWEDLNKYLIGNGWVGLTERAIERRPPFQLHFDWSIKVSGLATDGFLLIGKFHPLDSLVEGYRYQRPMTS